MQESIKYKQGKARRRAGRVRAKICGTALKPRLSLHLSNQRMFAQCVDDDKGQTILAMHDTILGNKVSHIGIARAAEFGKKFAQTAISKGLEKVVLDRGARKYHGRIKAFAEGARAAGLNF